MRALNGEPDLVLLNANVITLDAAQPNADAVVVSGGRVAWLGDSGSVPAAMLSSSDVIDCGGNTLVPGFIDAHCHVLAFAASLLAVDCSPSAVSDIDGILREIRRRAEVTPQDEWIRAAGYSEFDLREKRHPTRWELDRAAPHHPVRLNHRSGHACALNSLALERVGISTSTEEPRGGTIVRDLDSAEPNGLLLEMDDWLDERIPPLGADELRTAVAEASRRFISQGVTSVVDATPTNSPNRWKLLRRFAGDGTFVPSLTVMPGVDKLDAFLDAGLRYGDGDSNATLGHAKIMLTRSGGRLHPNPRELCAAVDSAHSRGFSVAIHAVESEAVIAAADALAAHRVPGLRDRMEHASECTPDALAALLRAMPVVVSQPRFIRDSGTRYISEFGGEFGDDADSLYPFRTLVDSGIALAASSDAPVSAPSPLLGMHAAITRESSTGEVIGAGEGISAIQALEMHTTKAAYSIGGENTVGSIVPGRRADFALLDADPTAISPERLPDVRVAMTMVGGKVVWPA